MITNQVFISVEHSQIMAVHVAIWFKVKIWRWSMVMYVCAVWAGDE